MNKEKIIVFGLGNTYKEHCNELDNNSSVVAYVDNNQNLWGKIYEGNIVICPHDINKYEFDKVVIFSVHAIEIKEQLKLMGIREEQISHYLEYTSQRRKKVYDIQISEKKNTALIITTPMGYHGGSIAAILLAKALVTNGYHVFLACEMIDEKFQKEYESEKLSFLIGANLQFPLEGNLSWVAEFDKVFVNTFPMIFTAIEISKYANVVLWLHESQNTYDYMDYWKVRILEQIKQANIEYWAVSNRASEIFKINVLDVPVKIVPYGIEDDFGVERRKSEIITFAQIGTIFPVKQQLLLLDAINEIGEYNESCRFLIIGNSGDTNYYQKMLREAEKHDNVNILDEVTASELRELYKKEIDVVLIPSKYESLPLTCVEAMMHYLPVICTNKSGMVDYIDDGMGGFLIDSQNGKALAEKLMYFIENRHNLYKMKHDARKVYETYFCYDKFVERIKKEI